MNTDLRQHFVRDFSTKFAAATDEHIQSELDRQGLTVHDDVVLVYPDQAMQNRLGARSPRHYEDDQDRVHVVIDTYLPMVMLRSDVERIYGPIQDITENTEEN